MLPSTLLPCSLQLHTQSPSSENSAFLSLPQNQIFLNLHHNASSKIFLYFLLHLYPSFLAMVRLLFQASHLSLFYPACASCPSSLQQSQGLSPSLLSQREKEDKKKLLQALPGWDLWSGLSSPHKIWFTSHSSGLLNFLDRHNQSEFTSAGEVWECLPDRKPNSTLCILSWFCYIPQNFAPFYHQQFLVKDCSRCLNVVADLCKCLLLGFSAMEAALTMSLVITWSQRLKHRKW